MVTISSVSRSRRERYSTIRRRPSISSPYSGPSQYETTPRTAPYVVTTGSGDIVVRTITADKQVIDVPTGKTIKDIEDDKKKAEDQTGISGSVATTYSGGFLKKFYERIDIAFGGRLPYGVSRAGALNLKIQKEADVSVAKLNLQQQEYEAKLANERLEAEYKATLEQIKREQDLAQTNWFEYIFQPTERQAEKTRNLKIRADQAQQQAELLRQAREQGLPIQDFNLPKPFGSLFPSGSEQGFLDKTQSLLTKGVLPIALIGGAIFLISKFKK